MSSTDLRSSWLIGEKKTNKKKASPRPDKGNEDSPPSSSPSSSSSSSPPPSPSSFRKTNSREVIPSLNNTLHNKREVSPSSSSSSSPSPSPSSSSSTPHATLSREPSSSNMMMANDTHAYHSHPPSPSLRRDNSANSLGTKSTLSLGRHNTPALNGGGGSGGGGGGGAGAGVGEKGSVQHQPRVRRKDDVEGLMVRVWDKHYKEGELFVQVVDSNVPSPRILQEAEMLLIVESKTFTQRWGSDFLVEVEDRAFGEIALELVTVTRLNRKKIGACKIIIQGRLEDGKAQEGWHNLAKRSRKGEIRSKGHLKIRICYTSALTRNKDYCMAKENFSEIMQILFDKETLIVCTLCKLYKEEDLSKALIRLFNSQKQASLLLMNLLMREIYTQEDTSTLFRRDSMATKTARNFFSLVAKSYLKRHILPFVAYVSYEVSKGSCYEVDPAKLTSTEEISGNATRLLASVKKFLTAILDSCDDLPISVRLFFSNLNTLIKKRIKSSSPIGALFFLRFVCPSVLFPSQYGLMEKPLDSNIFRALVLVTKILQNLVNGCLFHEEYMTIFNSFITDNIAPINGFFEQLCTEPKTKYVTEDDKQPPYTADEQVQLLSIVVRKIHIYFEKIQTEIEQDPIYTASPEETHQKVLVAKLKTLFLERVMENPTDEQ